RGSLDAVHKLFAIDNAVFDGADGRQPTQSGQRGKMKADRRGELQKLIISRLKCKSDILERTAASRPKADGECKLMAGS
ncbi:hypothetical protein, partial [Propionivibrio sp.]|uniref:hypothetical protein n=1 Tax=Propionivibrio sp. TaxID=2212460 RepID=UPI003BF17979